MQKLYKLRFPSKADWEAFKTEKLLDKESNLKPNFTIAGEGQLPKAPPTDWTQDPNKPEDNGWSLYPDYSVDVISTRATTIFKPYLILKPAKPLRSISGGNFGIVYKS